ncbi:unnamed protein product [Heterobilharzia americana]|nr:unnamed protein product [Heterobilharzia americana]
MPFFKILRKWIYRGVISDPYKEFFISDGAMHKLSHNDKSFSSNIFSSPFQSDRFTQSYVDWAFFWECHYTIVPTNLPCFLEHSASKILNTGKYLNVVQKCADDYELPACEELAYNQEHTIFLEKIDQAHLYASSLLLNLVLKKKDLKEHLKSVKRFFLLDQGDFIVHFLDAAASELCKRSEVVSQLRLSSLLESALRTSTANADRFKDNLAVVIFQFDLISQILMVLRAGSESKPDSPLPIEDKNLSGLEAFCLDYRVGWPIDLVLNRQVMDRYQMLFRHLLYCKHVERLLCKSWILVKLARKSDNLMTTWFTTAFLLTQRMLSFVQHFQYYMSVEIIEPAWHTFFKRLDKVSNLDVLLDSHLHFWKCAWMTHFAISISGINLSSSGVSDYGSIHSLRYSDAERPFLHDPTPSTALERPANKMKCARPQSSMSSAESIAAKVTREEFDRMSLSSDSAQIVSSVDAAFNRMLVLLLERIKLMAKHQSKLLSLVSRIDFNEFYTEYAIQLRRKDSVGLARNQGPSIDDGTLFEHRSTPPANTTHDIEDYI